MKVFLSYAVGQWDAPIASRLRAVAAAYDISILLPDRTQVNNNGLSADVQKKIKQSDAVIALVTKTAPAWATSLVNCELQAAAQLNKPIIPLIEQGIIFQGAPNSQTVYFIRSNPSAHESSLMKVLEQIRNQQRKKDLTTLGWIAGIALGLVALNELVSDEK
jgi:hypothetical protein